jgi:transposase-like protein
VGHTDTSLLQCACNKAVADTVGAVLRTEAAVLRTEPDPSEITAVAVASLRAGESPRLTGENSKHIARLAESETPFPPILVDRGSMKVIDGMHRLMATVLKGLDTIDVEFFDGTTEDAFLRAVQANVTHGFPLLHADRRAAAARIIMSHPYMSDRAVAESTGLAARTVAGVRERSADEVPQLNARVGRDGKVRPLNAADGRRRAAVLLTERPDASLREVARGAGVSPATVLDVRRRLERGDEPAPAPAGPERGGVGDSAIPDLAGQTKTQAPVMARAVQPVPSLVLEKLRRDPSLRDNEQGRHLLRLLHHDALLAAQGRSVAVPPHCAALVVQLARHYAQMWLDFAQEVEERPQLKNAWAAHRANGRR